MKNKKNLLNQKGQLTLEFMLAVVLIVSVSTLLGILTFTLSMTEALQYVTYSGARTYFAADIDVDTQADSAEEKVHNLLISLPFLAGAQASGWIKVPKKTRGANDYRQTYAQQIGVNLAHNQFLGYQLQFNVPILNVQIPFLNQMISPPDGAKDFNATLSSFLTREPSFKECQSYLATTYQVLLTLGYSNYQKDAGSFVPIMDNGC